MTSHSVLRLLTASLALSMTAPAATKQTPVPKLASGMIGGLVPHLLDGNQYRTIIYVTNYSKGAESYRLNLLNEDGSPALFHIAELGGQTGSLSGSLQPLATAVYHTNSGATGTQIGWANTDFLSTGNDISIYSIIESSDPLTGVWTTQSMVVADSLFVSDSETPIIQFDQTDGVVCGAAIVNTSSCSTADLIIDALDVKGNVLASSPLTLLPLHHTQFVLTGLFPQTAGIVGSMRFRNATAIEINTVAVMGIKATSYKTGWTQTSLPVVTLFN